MSCRPSCCLIQRETHETHQSTGLSRRLLRFDKFSVLVIITKNGLKYSRHARRCVHVTDHEFCMLLLCLQTRYPSLKKLAKEILGLDIQSREHSPVSEKITAAMFKNCHWRFLYPVLLVLLDFLKILQLFPDILWNVCVCVFVSLSGGGCSSGNEAVPAAQKRLGGFCQDETHQEGDCREKEGDEEKGREYRWRNTEIYAKSNSCIRKTVQCCPAYERLTVLFCEPRLRMRRIT